MNNSVVVTGGGTYIATEAVARDDGSELHYQIAVLRDDQIDRIVEAVIAALRKADPDSD